MNESNPSCCSTYRNIMGKDIAGMHPSARSKFCNNRPCRMDEQREDKVGKRGFPYPILSGDTTNKLRRDAGKSTCFGGYTITGTPLFPTTSADPTKKCRECFDFPQYFDCRDRTLGVYSLFVLSVFSLLYMAVSFCVDPVMSVHEEEAMQETDFRRQHAIEENYRKNFAGGDEENTSIGSGLIHVEKIVEEGNKIVDAVAHGDVAQLASQTLGVAASVVDGAIDIVDGEGDNGPRLKKGTQSGRVLVENPIHGAGDDDDDDDAPDRTDVQKMCQSCGKKPQRSNEEPYCQECWEDD